jgi:hypothetical protein
LPRFPTAHCPLPTAHCPLPTAIFDNSPTSRRLRFELILRTRCAPSANASSGASRRLAYLDTYVAKNVISRQKSPRQNPHEAPRRPRLRSSGAISENGSWPTCRVGRLGQVGQLGGLAIPQVSATELLKFTTPPTQTLGGVGGLGSLGGLAISRGSAAELLRMRRGATKQCAPLELLRPLRQWDQRERHARRAITAPRPYPSPRTTSRPRCHPAPRPSSPRSACSRQETATAPRASGSSTRQPGASGDPASSRTPC